MSMFFFGFGFSAQATSDFLHQTRPETAIAGTVRSPEKVARLAERNITAHLFDGAAPGKTLGSSLRSAHHIVLSIAPGPDGDPALQHHRADLEAAEKLSWLCYYSTVGVYGNSNGKQIDETAPRRPCNARSLRRMSAEQAWLDYAKSRGVPLAILRLAGIYGPGRSAFDKLTDGTARRVIKPGHVVNRIHVADIGRITARAAAIQLEGIFNLADDEPAPPQDLVTYAATLMDVAPPPDQPFEATNMTAMQRSFYTGSKRISNAAIKQALGIELLYPNYRAGLDAIWQNRP